MRSETAQKMSGRLNEIVLDNTVCQIWGRPKSQVRQQLTKVAALYVVTCHHTFIC